MRLPANVPAQLPRRSRWLKRILGLVAILSTVLVCVLLLTYWVFLSHGRKQLQVQFDAIRAAASPLTTTDLNALHAQDVTKDAESTQKWLAALRPFEEKQAIPTTVELIEDPDQMNRQLDLFRERHRDLELVASNTARVSFPRELGYGIILMLPEADMVKNALTSLRAEYELLALGDDFTRKLTNLRTRIAVADTLRNEPILVSMQIRINEHQRTLQDIRTLFLETRLSESQLIELQSLVRGIETHSQLVPAMHGERVILIHSFRYQSQLIASNFDPAGFPKQTTDNVNDSPRPEDCAKTLEFMSALIAAAQLSSQEILPETDRVFQELQALANTKDKLTKWRFVITIHMVPPVRGILVTDLQVQALRDLIDLGIAARRYAAAKDRLPQTEADLVPMFLPRWPNDPFSGQPMEASVDRQSWRVYSIDDARTIAARHGAETEDNFELSIDVRMPAAQGE